MRGLPRALRGDSLPRRRQPGAAGDRARRQLRAVLHLGRQPQLRHLQLPLPAHPRGDARGSRRRRREGPGRAAAHLSERVAVISSSYPREPGDASGHFVAAEVKRLLRAGHDVSVFVPGAGPSESDGARMHWIADSGAFGWPGALARSEGESATARGRQRFCGARSDGAARRGLV